MHDQIGYEVSAGRAVQANQRRRLAAASWRGRSHRASQEPYTSGSVRGGRKSLFRDMRDGACCTKESIAAKDVGVCYAACAMLIKRRVAVPNPLGLGEKVARRGLSRSYRRTSAAKKRRRLRARRSGVASVRMIEL